ncbi:MAG: glycine oxidase ThiO [Bryobacteraceae bacterium]
MSAGRLEHPDVLVIGGGIIGGSIAWRLAQRGISVTVLEAGRWGGEASWAGAGMLAPGGEYEEPSLLAEFALASLKRYPEFVEELAAASGLPIDFQRHGAMEVAANDGDWQRLVARAARQRGFGIPSEEVSGEDARALAPALAGHFHRVMFYPDDAAVDPRTLMGALRVAFERAGCRIREQTRVARVEARPDGVRVSTASGAMEAGAAVLAAGAWSGTLASGLPESFPVRGHLAAYRLPAGSLPPIVRQGGTYLVQREKGKTLSGTSMEYVGFDRTLDRGTLDDIRRRASHLVPMVAEAECVEEWIGFRPGARELQVRQHEDTRLWLAYGHLRNGILLAPETAHRISTAMEATESELLAH